MVFTLFFGFIFAGYAQGSTPTINSPRLLQSHEVFRSLRKQLQREGIRLGDPVMSEQGDVIVYNFPTESSAVLGVAALVDKNSGVLMDLIVTRQSTESIIEITGWISGKSRTFRNTSEHSLDTGEATIMFDPFTWVFIGKVLWGTTQAIALLAVSEYGGYTWGVVATLTWVVVYAHVDTFGNPTGAEWRTRYVEHVLLYTYTVNPDGTINYH